ncbi:hypothetical protein BB8028_0002g00100 [Beauveria bassiana]|uniref:Uncharacterized protein n=1 Tax=Beauveria bassiana TaxID=176275 RepID=A0A2S7Y0L3_BEABA|nr:hypothetical protein BB8028_0002g00100 [Beauveria bassiana]
MPRRAWRGRRGKCSAEHMVRCRNRSAHWLEAGKTSIFVMMKEEREERKLPRGVTMWASMPSQRGGRANMQEEVTPKPCLELAAQGILRTSIPATIAHHAAQTAYPACSCGLVQPVQLVQLASGRQRAHSRPSRALIELEVSTNSSLPTHHQQQQQQQQLSRESFGKFCQLHDASTLSRQKERPENGAWPVSQQQQQLPETLELQTRRRSIWLSYEIWSSKMTSEIPLLPPKETTLAAHSAGHRGLEWHQTIRD